MLEKVIALISLCISGFAVFVTVFNTHYQIVHNQSLEKEKIRLEIFSTFIAYCQKKAAGASTPQDDFELIKVHSKLMLIVDHKLNYDIDNLYKKLFSAPGSQETMILLEKVSQEMWLRLKKFNRQSFRRSPRLR